MPLVLVPVRYPLSRHSEATLEEAVRIAEERNADLTVLHVNLYQRESRISRADLRQAVERAVGRYPKARYVVRTGFLVEETILDEAVAEDADVVVIGAKQVSRWRRMIRRLVDDPDVERYLQEELDCEVITVRP
jgi:nucleotide-binding universal stress UspA family protein